MKNLIKTIFALSITISALTLNAQKERNPKIIIEQVKQTCQNVPLEKRALVTVGKFTQAANGLPAQVPDNMNAMLINALQNIQCFRTLIPLNDIHFINDEIDYSKGEYSDPLNAIEKGKQLSPDVVFIGKITSYNREYKSGTVLLVKWNETKINLSFVLTAVNAKTRQVLYSQSFDAIGKSSGGSVWIPMLGTNGRNSQFEPAMNEALERCIIQAVEYIADHKDQLPIYDANAPAPITINTTTLIVKGVGFTTSTEMLASLQKLSCVKEATKLKWLGTEATYVVKHIGSTDEFMIALDKQKMVTIDEVNTGKASVSMYPTQAKQ